jgi:hypothetical protein
MHPRRQLATIAGCSARRKPLEYTPAHEQIFGVLHKPLAAAPVSAYFL